MHEGVYVLKNNEIGNYLHSKISNNNLHTENVREFLISLDNNDFYVEFDPASKNLYLVQDPWNLPLPGNKNFRIKILITKKKFNEVFERVKSVYVSDLMFIDPVLTDHMFWPGSGGDHSGGGNGGQPIRR